LSRSRFQHLKAYRSAASCSVAISTKCEEGLQAASHYRRPSPGGHFLERAPNEGERPNKVRSEPPGGSTAGGSPNFASRPSRRPRRQAPVVWTPPVQPFRAAATGASGCRSEIETKIFDIAKSWFFSFSCVWPLGFCRILFHSPCCGGPRDLKLMPHVALSACRPVRARRARAGSGQRGTPSRCVGVQEHGNAYRQARPPAATWNQQPRDQNLVRRPR
jgi:hypothetical protein